jgi:pimeloyl-ACP methyl ester carboxylesterase
MIAAGMLAGGCAGTPLSGSTDRFMQSAIDQGFTSSRVEAGEFTLKVLHRGLNHAGACPVVYIEGDGRGFITRRRVSSDPTPRDPVALRMALADPSPAVIYIVRPCQYIMSAACEPRYWTTHRYAERVVDAVDQALTRVGSKGNVQRYGLVGYSGGGVIAALLAQRRGDVDWLVTVSAPLDHAAWTTHHGDTPLSGSLNPAENRDKLAGLRQLHLAGGDDRTVPSLLLEDYAHGMPQNAPAVFRTIEGMNHNGWPARWRSLICESDFWREACSQE